ncbi:MAG TPA: DUF1559 domain-containing protein [Gemmataceae bacterium]|nr:DUF1559 domain-containing protein [Gemmataceae bacterium]
MRGPVNIFAGALTVFLAGSLLLIAVENVRETAARTQCSNNLKQIVLSMHNYNDTYGHFPTATMSNPKLAYDKQLSWLLGVYPFVESSQLYKLVEKDKSWDAEENRWAALFTIKTYTCPGFQGIRPTSTLMSSHYVGIAGLGPDAVSLPLSDPRAGAFGYQREWIIGKSNHQSTRTLVLVADTTRVAEAWTSGGWPTVRGLEDDGPPLIGPGGQFGGVHKAGAMVAFADASVGLWRPTEDAKTIKAMATLRENETFEAAPDH